MVRPCLGMHLLNTNKGGDHVRLIPPSEFLEYMDAFAMTGGKCINVAKDSHHAGQGSIRAVIVNCNDDDGTNGD